MLKIEMAVLKEKLDSIDKKLRDQDRNTAPAAAEGLFDISELSKERHQTQLALISLQNKFAPASAGHDVLSANAFSNSTQSARYVLILQQ
jgi:hypothetical protein